MHWRRSRRAAHQRRASALCRNSISQETTWMRTALLYWWGIRTCGSCIWLITNCCPSPLGTYTSLTPWTSILPSTSFKKDQWVYLYKSPFVLFSANSVNWRYWRSWIWVGTSWKRSPPLCPAARDCTPSSPTPTISACSQRSSASPRSRSVCVWVTYDDQGTWKPGHKYCKGSKGSTTVSTGGRNKWKAEKRSDFKCMDGQLLQFRSQKKWFIRYHQCL